MWSRSLGFLTALALVATPANADEVFGRWASEPNDEGAFLVVAINACETGICGNIAEVHQGADDTLIGKPIIWDMAARGGGDYRGGTIWAPDTDKEYRSKMKLDGNMLRVSGCIGPICRSQNWSRVK